MRARVVAFGGIDGRLRAELEGLAERVEIHLGSQDEEPLNLVARIRPHLVVIGQDASFEATALAGADPVPVLSLRDEPGADVVLGGEGDLRARSLASARKLVHLREGWLAHRDDDASRLLRRLDQEFVRANRYRHPLALAAVGVDRLAELSSVHGELAVDAFLDALEEAARRGVREVDVVFRPARGEVWAILPETDPSGARSVAERLRTLASKLLFKPPAAGTRRPLPLKATTSVGLATCPLEGVPTAHALLTLARAALETARLDGGDRVICVSPSQASDDGPG